MRFIQKIRNNEEFLLSCCQKSLTLDFGAGQGKLVKLLIDHDIDTKGCDILDSYETDPSSTVDGINVGTNLFKSTPNTLPFKGKQFNQIVSNQVLEHVENLKEIANEFNRVSTSGATLYLLFPTSDIFIEPHTKIPLLNKFKVGSLMFKLLLLIGYLLKNRTLNDLQPYLNNRTSYFKNDVHFRKLNEIIKIFESSGFQVYDRSKIWLHFRYKFSFPLNLISRFIHPKYWIGCYLEAYKR